MTADLFWILLIAIVASLFWQQRRQSELAKNYIVRRCQQTNVQLISIARGSHSFGWPKGPLDIQTRYYFEFSVNGLDCYQGYAVMKGMRIKEIYMPAYPVLEE
ncbi:hypothetical protein RN22_21315 [Grimontia sp. AD028]|uniref:DUF3301 domain-containing protein n=2 Tax=Grimontia TaxID=246861 RepID=A0A128EVM3_9GAMM|nr:MULTISPECIES: DUF3301 domain-containing protein [Grimontia]EOD81090.1 hypothetical protein D515_04584 [Grimontia indica]KKD58384.1 hypothetical protein RN22_21315 [Grimontia sp. AD028]CZF78026.1 hypothetical protein GMA8713_00416 [Grimontia marina]